MTSSRDTILELQALFDGVFANNSYGESVSMAEHMTQTAQVALKYDDDNVLVAALLHDVGHGIAEGTGFSLQDTADREHEELGAEYLQQRGFNEQIVAGVRYHVAAKRYLVAVEPSYGAVLSEASHYTLGLQGGPMSSQEVTTFEKIPHFDTAVKVRRCDDAGKDPNQPAVTFEYFHDAIVRVLDNPMSL